MAGAPGVRRTTRVLTVQLAPERIVAIVNLEFDDSLRIPEVEQLVEKLEAQIQREQPHIVNLFVRPEPGGGVA